LYHRVVIPSRRDLTYIVIAISLSLLVAEVAKLNVWCVSITVENSEHSELRDAYVECVKTLHQLRTLHMGLATRSETYF